MNYVKECWVLLLMVCASFTPSHAQESPYFVTYDHHLEEPGHPPTLGGAVAVPEGLDGAGGAGEDHVFDRKLRRGRAEGWVHEADERPQRADVDPAEAPAQDVDRPGARVTQAAGDAQERRLAGAVGAEEGPVLAGAHAPVDVVQEHGLLARPDAHAGDGEQVRRVEGARKRVRSRGHAPSMPRGRPTPGERGAGWEVRRIFGRWVRIVFQLPEDGGALRGRPRHRRRNGCRNQSFTGP